MIYYQDKSRHVSEIRGEYTRIRPSIKESDPYQTVAKKSDPNPNVEKKSDPNPTVEKKSDRIPTLKRH